jgi:molybdopterin-containing oxidoreductase family molybdopterin binding subunit
MCPEARTFRSLPIIQFYEAALTGDPYPIKALWVSNHNPGDSHSNRNKFKKAVAQMEFIVTVELFMTTTAEYSDIVLPGCTSFESTGITIPWGSYLHAKPYFQLNPKVVEPYYECKIDLDIFNELAPRMGLEEFFKKSEEEYVEDLFDSAPPPLKGITMEKLKEGPVRHPYAEGRLFPSTTGRLEFYAETMTEFGEALPVFKEPPESARQPMAQKYPLTILNMHSKHRHHSTFTNIDWLREFDPEPTLDINPIDADKRGIHDGDMVTAFNNRASVTLKARFNEGMRPGYVSVGEGWQARDFIKGHHNDLTADEMNPAQEANSETIMQFQDILCEVEKAEEV